MKKKLTNLLSLVVVSAILLSACSTAAQTDVTIRETDSLNEAGETPVFDVTPLAGTDLPAVTDDATLTGPTDVSTGEPTPLDGTGQPVTTEETPVAAATAVPTDQGLPLTGADPGMLNWQTEWKNFFVNLPPDNYTTSVDALAAEIESGTPPFLLDIRRDDEVRDDGYIKGSVHIPYNALFTSLDKLPALDQPIVIYSSSGHRGSIVLAGLRILGYSNTYLLPGGMSAWLQAGKPAEKGEPPDQVAGEAPDIDPEKLAGIQEFFEASKPIGHLGVIADRLNGELASDKKPFLLDIRSQAEVDATGTIEGAVVIPAAELFDNLHKLPSDPKTPIVTISTTGHRAAMVVVALIMNGYSNVRSLFGGIKDWSKAGYSVTQ